MASLEQEYKGGADGAPRSGHARFPRLGAVVRGTRMDLGKVAPVSFLMRAFRRLRVLGLGDDVHRLLTLPIYRAHLAAVKQDDPLFFLSHRNYLARDLTIDERAIAAARHYLTDQSSLRPDVLDDVYHGEGLVLWSRQVKDHLYQIRLTCGLDVALEGAQSLSFHADDVRVCVMSFSVIPRRFVADETDSARNAVLITRKQLSRDRSYQKPFFEAFDRSAPAHLVLAALEGIVQARGGTQLFGIRAPSHPIYSEDIAPHLAAAYCDFWVSLEGEPSSDRAYAMGIPMRLRPVENMKADRRDRAVARRSHAEEIRASARAVMAESLTDEAALL